MLRGVVIDTREPPWCQQLTPGGLKVATSSLSAGDAWLATDDAMIVVERKTLHDLMGSIADGRLLNQAAAMRATGKWAYLVVVGLPTVVRGVLVLRGKPTQWQWRSVQGALLTVQELGVGVAWCESDKQYAETLEWIASRSRGPARIEARREAVIETPAERILSALPGLASGRVGSLLKHCGSPAWALDYLTRTQNEGGSVPGIGPATKAGVRSAMGLPADMRLAVVMEDEGDE